MTMTASLPNILHVEIVDSSIRCEHVVAPFFSLSIRLIEALKCLPIYLVLLRLKTGAHWTTNVLQIDAARTTIKQMSFKDRALVGERNMAIRRQCDNV